MTTCDACSRPATVCQRNAEQRVSTFRCDGCALTDRATYRTEDLCQAGRVRLAETQQALYTPGRMFA